MTSNILIRQNIDEFRAFLASNYPAQRPIRVIENVAEYAFIIKIIGINSNDLNVSIQISNKNEEGSVPIVIVNGRDTNVKVERLQKELTSLIADFKPNESNFLIDFFKKAILLIGSLELKHVSESRETSQKIKTKNVQRVHAQDDSHESEKKPSMKTADAVVNRILWDENIAKAFITVGYLDRFFGLVECAFDEFDWGDIVLADLGALAIPEHRICYFKYKNEIVWDKKRRLDNVYGSTGSNLTIIDIIERLKDTPFERNKSDDDHK